MTVIRGRFGRSGDPGPTAFVLGGGGNLGAIQVGMLRALFERDITPDLVIGCSVGALNGAAIAGNPTLQEVDRLEQLWTALAGPDIFPPSRLQGPWLLFRKGGGGLYPNHGLKRVISRWLRYARFERTAIPLHVVATSLKTQRDVWFSSGEVLPALLASTSLPAIFPAVEIDGELFIDGGVVNNVPVSKAIEEGAKRIIVLHVGNFDRERPRPKRPLDTMIQAFSIARGYRFKEEIDHVPSDVEVFTLPGVDPGPLKYNDFSKGAELVRKGYDAAAGFLDDLEAASGE